MARWLMRPNQRSTWLSHEAEVGGEVKMVARSFGEPSAHLGMLVGRIVVHHEMKVELWWSLLVNEPQEGEKLLMAMTLAAFAEPLAGGHIQGGEQRRGPMTDGIMGIAFDVAQSHRQRGLRTIERLYLALLIDTQHHRVVRRIEVKTCDITNLLDEKGVAGQLEGVAQMRPGVGPKLINFNECAHGERAPHCQDTTPGFDTFARAKTKPARTGGSGRASAGSEWLARRARPIACRSV